MELKTVNLTIKQVIALLVAFVLGGATVAVGFFIGFNKEAVTEPAAPVASASAAAVSEPASKPATKDIAKAYEIVPGTGDEYGQNKTAYQCAAGAGFKTVQVPIGQTIQADGAKYILKEAKDGRRQKSVTVNVTLSAGVSAPVIIVNGADHQKHPDLWGNHVLEVDLRPGGTGNYPLATEGYVESAFAVNGGILNVVICTKIG